MISSVSYVVGSAINGQKITGSGLANAVAVGAISGGLGAAIGTISLGASAISVTATVLTKAMASTFVGAIVGANAGMQAEGSVPTRILTGLYTGLIATAATFCGSLIDASSFGFLGNMFANFAATLFVGAPAEILAVATQLGIAKSENATPTGSSSKPTSGGTYFA